MSPEAPGCRWCTERLKIHPMNAYTLETIKNNGEVVKTHQVIDCIEDALNPFTQYDEYLAYAKSEELEYVVSNTTEAGIAYVEGDKLTDRPAKSYPAKLFCEIVGNSPCKLLLAVYVKIRLE